MRLLFIINGINRKSLVFIVLVNSLILFNLSNLVYAKITPSPSVGTSILSPSSIPQGPSINITSPQNGSKVSGTINIEIRIEKLKKEMIDRVLLLLDNSSIGTILPHELTEISQAQQITSSEKSIFKTFIAIFNRFIDRFYFLAKKIAFEILRTLAIPGQQRPTSQVSPLPDFSVDLKASLDGFRWHDSLSFTSAPLSDPLDLKATITDNEYRSGDSYSFFFYCDSSDDSTSISKNYVKRFLDTAKTTITLSDLCNYSARGTYYPKVIVELARGDGSGRQSGSRIAQDRVKVVFSSSPTSTSTPTPTSTKTPTPTSTSTTPYLKGQKSYDTTKTTNGSHSLKAKLILNDKSVIESKQITIEVDNKRQNDPNYQPPQVFKLKRIKGIHTDIFNKNKFFAQNNEGYNPHNENPISGLSTLSTNGLKNILAFSLQFKDKNPYPIPPSVLRSKYFEEVKSFYRTQSRGKLGINVNVNNSIIPLPYEIDCDDFFDIATEFKRPSSIKRFTEDILNYIHEINPIKINPPPTIVFFTDMECDEGNLGITIKGEYEVEGRVIDTHIIYIISEEAIQFTSNVITHELGHTTGLSHSFLWKCKNYSSTCFVDSFLENSYKDIYSMMSNYKIKLVGFNAPQLALLGWLPKNEIKVIEEESIPENKAQRFVILPLESKNKGIKTLVIRSEDSDFGNIWIEYRQDENIVEGNGKQGALIRSAIRISKDVIGFSGFSYVTGLFDTSQNDSIASVLKAALTPEQGSWRIPNTQIFIKTISATPQGLELEILKPKVEIISPTNGEKISERITKIPLITNITTPEAPKNFIENVTIEIQGGEGSGYQNAEVIKPEMFTSCTMLGSNQAYSGKGPSQCENKPVEWDTTHLQDGYYILKAKLYEKNEQDPIAESEPVVVIKGSSGFVESASTCAYVVPILYDNELGIYTPQAGEYSDIFDSKDCQYKVLTCFGRTLTNPQGCCQEKDKKTGQSTPCLPVNYLPNY